MANSIKRPISLLLTLILLISAFAILPVVSADAAAVTDDPWIFAANDGRTYDLDGKWVRFGDEDFRLSGTGAFTLTNRTTYIYQLKYGNTHVADSRSTQAGAVHIGDTFYVTGQGTEAHPYIFTPNIIFFDNAVSTFGKGATVSLGYENLEATASGNNGVAVPGDGFKNVCRMQAGASNYVRFLQHDETDYQPNQVNSVLGYIGVKDGEYGTYNGSGNFTNATNHFLFEGGNDTLYYLGRQDYGANGLYLFSETVTAKTSFSGSNKTICTVTWENQDGAKLKTMTYNLGDTPDDGGLSPSKAEDAAYTYSFSGFEPEYAPLSDDMTYVATYTATPKGPMTYTVDAWIFPTNDNKVYDELAGMCYSYNGGAATGFTSGGSFSVVNDQILLCGVVVADIDTSHPSYKTFANTVYVTGAGSPEDPFVFTANYIYGDPLKTNVKDGVVIAVPGVNTLSGDKGTANPGDGFKAMSKIRVSNNRVQFMQQYGYYSASRSLLGVGETTYGYRYSKTKALPFNFVSDDNTLYFFEKTSGGIYQFSETKPPMRYTFRPADSTIYTVKWLDDDRSLLDEETYYVGAEPAYKGGTPQKTPHDQYTYTFNGWSPAIESVTADAEYTATYTQTERIFCHHSLSLNGDIALNFYLNVTPEQINTGSGAEVMFERNIEGNIKRSTDKLSTSAYKVINNKTYYKATVTLPAAEMTYNVHASVRINGVLQDETDDYRARDYADVILGASAGTYDYQEDLVILVKSLLNYGANAQLVFNRNTGSLANSGVIYSPADVSPATISSANRDMETGLSDVGLEYYTSSVVYLSKTTLRHYYYITDQGLFDTVKNSVTFNGEPVEAHPNGSYIYFECSDISAADLDAPQTIRFGSALSYDYSVLDYTSLLAVKGTASQQKLAQSVYHYSTAADAYFARFHD